MAEAEYPLHKAVFTNDVSSLRKCLRSRGADVNKRDIHTLTPLILAAKLGRHECLKLLLDNDADVDCKSEDGWSALDEAVIYGNRDMVELLFRAAHARADVEVESCKPKLKAALTNFPDFSLTLHWELTSWIPLLSRILPADECHIHKLGSQLRIDSTLQGFKDMHWCRGNLSFYIDCDKLPKVVVVDHNRRVKQDLQPSLSSKYVEDMISVFLSKDVVHSYISTRPIELRRARTGWVWRSDKVEVVAGHSCPVYDVTGITLIQSRRMEHLSEADVKRLSSLRQRLNASESLVADSHDGDGPEGTEDDEDEGDEIDGRVKFRPSLPPPESSCTCTWEQYINSKSTGLPHGVGREPSITETRRHFKPTVALSDDFPIPRDLLLDIVEIIAPYQHFHKVKSLVSRLPPGFPLRLELPLFPTVSGKVIVQEFNFAAESSSFPSAASFCLPQYRSGHVFGPQ